MGDFVRPCHVRALALFERMNSEFLRESCCYFGGGTRLTMTMGEYRESNDVDFMCSDTSGWRALRSSVTNRSLGSIFTNQPELLREVRADRYAIRTFVQIHDTPVKLEIIKEGNLSITGEASRVLPIMMVAQASSVAQELLANADRGSDPAFGFRDIIDLAHIAVSWDEKILEEGWLLAAEAYGDQTIQRGLSNSLSILKKEPQLWHRSLSRLSVTTGTDNRLDQGLRKLGQRCGISWCRDSFLGFESHTGP